MKVYIFGNGFDCAHKLPTHYSDFREWLIDTYRATPDGEIGLPLYQTNYKRLEVYSEEEFARFFLRLIDEADPQPEEEKDWARFEDMLAELNWQSCLNGLERPNDVTEYSAAQTAFAERAEMCGDSCHILRELFEHWTRSLNEKIEEDKKTHALPRFRKILKPKDKYLTFNYTSTLETFYSIQDVCHIHGNLEKYEEPIFGHGDPGYREQEYEAYEYEAYQKFRAIYRAYKKDTDAQIGKHQHFFDGIRRAKKMYFFGLSMGSADIPYLCHLFRSCRRLRKIYLNVYKREEHAEKENILRRCGAPCKIIPWFPL